MRRLSEGYGEVSAKLFAAADGHILCLVASRLRQLLAETSHWAAKLLRGRS